jgi:hypothetical protein
LRFNPGPAGHAETIREERQDFHGYTRPHPGWPDYGFLPLDALAPIAGRLIDGAFRNHLMAALMDGFSQVTGREPLRFVTFLGLDS